MKDKFTQVNAANSRKAIAILGSPRTNGICASMLNHAVRTFTNAGYDVERINLYEKQLSVCRGCRACIKTGGCILKDDIQDICTSLKECDTVILAAPVYWANVPAPVKNLFDRLLGTAMEETSTLPKPRLPGKNYMILTACNTPFPFSWICGQSTGAIRCMDEFFKTAGMKCIGKYVCSNTSKIKELPPKLMKRIERCCK